MSMKQQAGQDVAAAGVEGGGVKGGGGREEKKKNGRRVVGARWPLLRGFAWVGCVLGGGLVGLAVVWRDDLSVKASGGGEWFVMGSHAVFMTRVFWFHLGIAFAVAAGFAMVARARWLMVVAGVFAGMMLAPAAWEARRFLPGALSARLAVGEVGLTVMSVNLMYGATDVQKTLSEIARVDADVVVFQEWTPKAEEGLAAALKVTYPHNVSVTREDAFGQAVFSRRAFVEPVRQFPGRQVPGGRGSGGSGDWSGAMKKEGGFGWTEPQIRVVVDAGDGTGTVVPVVIYNVHVLPPVGLMYIETQRSQVLALAEIAREEIGGAGAPRVLFVGDFNATANTAHLGAMHAAGMRDAVEAAGEGWVTTWPRTSWLKYLPGIRLDHVLANDQLRAVSAGTGQDNGSDHRPVWARFAVPVGGMSR